MISHTRSTSAPQAAAEPGASSEGGESDPDVRTVSSQEVLRGDAELRIDHHGNIYRLRITNSGKLILTK